MATTKKLILKFAIASPIMYLWIHLGLFILSFGWVLMLKPLLNYISRWSSLFTVYLRNMGLLEVWSKFQLCWTQQHCICNVLCLFWQWRVVVKLEWLNLIITTPWHNCESNFLHLKNVVHQMLEYIKLTKVTIVQIFGLMEDEWCFNTLNFMKASFKIG
jgi:hypothetical protein